ncbi:hypothetical protein JCM8547_007439 [Rhodosporidiobolus lusitaniae]
MADRPSFAPRSPDAQRSSSRPRSLSRRQSQGHLATPQRPSTSSSSASHAPPTPALPNPAVTASLLSAATTSPHYTTSLRSRHSLYGIEDRVVLDLGSRVWKAGFSGEAAPREARSVVRELGREAKERGAKVPLGGMNEGDDAIWGLEKGEPGEEEWEVREERVKRLLRDVWFNNLMVDPKTRKVIVVENPLLSTAVKDMIARVLFDNLQIPSLSFASAPLLSLMAAGTVTGLVVDVGHLETTVLPVFHSRPLFPLLTSTPRAGARLNRRLRNLLLSYGSYVPPPSGISAPPRPTPTLIPREVLTEELIEEIKTRMCFVGEEIPLSAHGGAVGEQREPRQAAREASIATTSSAMSLDTTATSSDDPDLDLIKHLALRYSSPTSSLSSRTTTVSFRIPNLSNPTSALGRGWIEAPGWVRERAAEVLWEEGDRDELGLAGVVLECLLKLPTDLKKPMASSLLLTGSTAMLPGFFNRFKSSLVTQLTVSHPPSPPPSPSSSSSSETDAAPAGTPRQRRRRVLHAQLHTLRHSPRYAPLVSLAPHIAILNHPSPSSPSSSSVHPSSLAREREGSAPAFSPALQAWVGGSLAGALKTGGMGEMTREGWDESRRRGRGGRSGEGEEGGEEEGEEEEEAERGTRGRVPDWSSGGGGGGGWTRVA